MAKLKGACQSCGMPLAHDEQGGGTNADSSKNLEYCSHYYQNGAFTEPNLTAAQMTAKVKGKMKEMHLPGFAAIFSPEIFRSSNAGQILNLNFCCFTTPPNI